MKSKLFKSLLVLSAVVSIGGGTTLKFSAQSVSNAQNASNAQNTSNLKYEPGTCGDGQYLFTPTTKFELSSDIVTVEEADEGDVNLNCINTENITDMSYLFTYNEVNPDVSEWNTSNVTDMTDMFLGSSFRGDISNWDVSSLQNAKYMFADSWFNGDISRWNTSNVTDMSGMFQNSIFNGDISNWDTSNVTNMSGMFQNSIFNGYINDWNVNSVTDMSSMFEYSLFDDNLFLWDVDNVTDMSNMFKGSQFNRYIDNWNISNVVNISNMFSNSKFNHPLSTWDFSSVDTSLGFLGFDESSHYDNVNAGNLLLNLDETFDTCSNIGRSNYFYAATPESMTALDNLNRKGCNIQVEHFDAVDLNVERQQVRIHKGDSYNVYDNVSAISFVDGFIQPVLVDDGGFIGDGTDQIGIYQITFSATDSLGIHVVKTFQVNVLA